MPERRNCRCVPSAQSKSSRSPPRRMSVAVGALLAVGMEPDVPRNTMARSTRRLYDRPSSRKDELLARRDRGASQMVPLLKVPDRLPRVAPVVRSRDRPQRVVGLHHVGPPRPGAARRMGDEDNPGDEENEQDTYGAYEHMYAA